MATKKAAAKAAEKKAVAQAKKAGDALEAMYGPKRQAKMKVNPGLETHRRALVVYTSFPIASMEDHGVSAAKRLGEMVKRHGGIPLNPLDIKPWEHPNVACPESYVTSNGHSAACYLRADIAEMLECDAVLLAQGCWDSIGCRAEMEVARVTGIPFYFETADGYIMDNDGRKFGVHPDEPLLFQWGS